MASSLVENHLPELPTPIEWLLLVVHLTISGSSILVSSFGCVSITGFVLICSCFGVSSTFFDTSLLEVFLFVVITDVVCEEVASFFDVSSLATDVFSSFSISSSLSTIFLEDSIFSSTM